jgi:hypothetical protein
MFEKYNYDISLCTLQSAAPSYEQQKCVEWSPIKVSSRVSFGLLYFLHTPNKINIPKCHLLLRKDINELRMCVGLSTD